MFFEKLLGFLSEQEIEFAIKVQPGTDSILIPPYRMTPIELKELETQLRDLSDKGFIRLSSR